MCENVLKRFEKQLEGMAHDIPDFYSAVSVISMVFSSMQEADQEKLSKVPYLDLKHIVLQVGKWE